MSAQPVVMLTPLPPTRSGIAHYASILLPALQRRVSVDAIDSARSLPPSAARIYHLGNNPHHEWIYRAAMETPGVIVLHDLVLHHLIVEMTLARGDADGYASALRASHGAAGEAWARGRAAGLHSEMGNFLMPASIDVAQRSRAVIVHNQWAADRLSSFGVTTPLFVVPHPFEPQPEARGRRKDVRAQHGFAAEDRVIGLFGFLTSAKRGEVVLAAFEEARKRDARVRLLVVGEPAPNINSKAFQDDGITFTGYVEDAEFAAYFAAVDRLVNLRYPSAGETSGTLIRAFEAGKPVAVSDYAQFAEMPDDCVVKIGFGAGEVDALAAFFTGDLPDPAASQKAWLDEHASLDRTVQGYLDALEASMDTARLAATESPNQDHKGTAQRAATKTQTKTTEPQRTQRITEKSGFEESSNPAVPVRPVAATIPLFPWLDVIRVEADPLTIELENRGDGPLLTRVYGQPGYRLLVKLFDGDIEIYDRWLTLPRDLAVGERTTISLPVRGRGTLALYHAIEGIPMLEPPPFARVVL